jgi:hypothetical protein
VSTVFEIVRIVAAVAGAFVLVDNVGWRAFLGLLVVVYAVISLTMACVSGWAAVAVLVALGVAVRPFMRSHVRRRQRAGTT